MVLRTSKIQNSAQMTFRKRDRPRFFERGANSHTTLTAQGRPVVRVCPVAAFGDTPSPQTHQRTSQTHLRSPLNGISA